MLFLAIFWIQVWPSVKMPFFEFGPFCSYQSLKQCKDYLERWYRVLGPKRCSRRGPGKWPKIDFGLPVGWPKTAGRQIWLAGLLHLTTRYHQRKSRGKRAGIGRERAKKRKNVFFCRSYLPVGSRCEIFVVTVLCALQKPFDCEISGPNTQNWRRSFL